MTRRSGRTTKQLIELPDNFVTIFVVNTRSMKVYTEFLISKHCSYEQRRNIIVKIVQCYDDLYYFRGHNINVVLDHAFVVFAKPEIFAELKQIIERN